MTESAHWDRAYTDKGARGVSWYAETPSAVLALLDRLDVPPTARVLDAGGGASSLAAELQARGHRDVTVLDLSDQALALARQGFGSPAAGVTWVVADVRGWRPPHPFDVWHDRAVLHFMTSAADRAAYLATLRAATTAGSLVVLATFAPDGPEQCSGLPVQRYDAAGLTDLLGTDFALIEDSREEHITPWGSVQPFTRCAFRRL